MTLVDLLRMAARVRTTFGAPKMNATYTQVHLASRNAPSSEISVNYPVLIRNPIPVATWGSRDFPTVGSVTSRSLYHPPWIGSAVL